MKFKKPKFWDYKKPNYLSYLLLPFTFPIILNNYFLNFKKVKNKNIKTICIGNIYIGGTAKTPLTLKIYKILSNLNFKVSTIKKYYSNQLDEQKLLKTKTKLYCFTKRKRALDEAIKDGVDVAIFDDGLQDRSLNYDLNFVCFSNLNGVGNGLLIPAGPLREKIKSISKYDAVFLNGNLENNEDLKDLIKKQKPSIKIFEACYTPININKLNKTEKYLIFSGIGNPKNFIKTLIKNNFNIVKEIIFPDHYHYTKQDIEKIKHTAKSIGAKILTTEKDYIKLSPEQSNGIDLLKIELNIKNENEFINFLKSNI